METLCDAAPIKFRVWHCCFAGLKTVARLFLPIVLFLVGPEYRKRGLIHSGTSKDILYELQKYGLNKAYIPTLLGGTFDVDRFRDRLNERLDAEKAARCSVENTT